MDIILVQKQDTSVEVEELVDILVMVEMVVQISHLTPFK